MLNRSGVKKTSLAGPDNQILAYVDLQASVGCIVSADLGVTEGGKKIVKAGTPIALDFKNTQTPVTAPADGEEATAVLLHNVDVTDGNANGTALIFGFVNLNRLDATTAAKITTDKIGGVTFLKL